MTRLRAWRERRRVLRSLRDINDAAFWRFVVRGVRRRRDPWCDVWDAMAANVAADVTAAVKSGPPA